MKRSGIIFLFIFLFLIVIAGGTGTAGVQGTKHDLSTGGPGPIKSAVVGGTSETCVFCHTPHSAASIANAPLWNKDFNPSLDPTPAYEVYDSDVLNALGYPNADKPLTSLRAVHIKTRLCLSCHDGTIALGKLANLPSGLGSDIPMLGTTGTTDVPYAMPHEATGYIGVKLQDDHPVAIQYTNANDSELAASPVGGKVKVEGPESGMFFVECTSCHDPHNSTNRKFMVDTNVGSNICKSCHNNKTSYSTSIHATSGVSYRPPDGAGPLQDIGLTVGEVQCMGCHYPHKAGISDTSQLPKATPAVETYTEAGYYLLSFQEQMSCFNDTDRWGQTLVSACHGTNAPATQNIESLVAPAKFRAHWVGNYTNKHRATEAQASLWFGVGNPNEHVECQDCHNPHTAGNTPRPIGSNAVVANGPLYGTGGVTPGPYPFWNPGFSTGTYTPIQPRGVTSTTSNGATYEYEICLKCHSDFAWNPATPPSSPSFVADPLIVNKGLTNQAMEFGNNAVSSHPVIFTNPNIQGTYLAPWTAQPDMNMYCSDCHNNDLLTPAGPHGSNNRSILYLQYNPATIGQTGAINAELCYGCHDPIAYYANNNAALTGFSNNGLNVNLHYRHMQPPPNGVTYQGGVQKACTNCHVNPIHGSNKTHLISYSATAGLPPDPAPYGTYSYITSYTDPGSGNYVMTNPSNCTAVTCHANTGKH